MADWALAWVSAQPTLGVHSANLRIGFFEVRHFVKVGRAAAPPVRPHLALVALVALVALIRHSLPPSIFSLITP
jgi:hypothetical protein